MKIMIHESHKNTCGFAHEKWKKINLIIKIKTFLHFKIFLTFFINSLLRENNFWNQLFLLVALGRFLLVLLVGFLFKIPGSCGEKFLLLTLWMLQKQSTCYRVFTYPLKFYFFTSIDFFIFLSVQSSAASINYSVALKHIIYALNQS